MVQDTKRTKRNKFHERKNIKKNGIRVDKISNPWYNNNVKRDR
jgi:hypothetical protein